jgi:uncharacterized protein YdhG (YjbR/CyaY superfamily)
VASAERRFRCGFPCKQLTESAGGEGIFMRTGDTKGNGANGVEDYLAKVPEPARTALEKIRATIRSVVPPETTEKLSYGMPAFHYKGALVAYAAFKDHCSLFPMQASLMDEMKEELKNYRTSKGTLQFPQDKPLPSALLKKIVKLRVAENDIRFRSKAAKRVK